MVLFILGFVGTLLLFLLLKSSGPHHKKYSGEKFEFFWTLLPGAVLGLIGAPSLLFLYSSEAQEGEGLTLKVVGSQWFWGYEYGGLGIFFESYLKSIEELVWGEPRLLEADSRVVFPLSAPLQLVVGASDVLHSWALPSAGLKVDAAPGRINLLSALPFSCPGVFYGQCSEICGANHSFMPICVEASPFMAFSLWAQVGSGFL